MNKEMLDIKLLKVDKVFNEQGIEDPTMIKVTFSILDFEPSAHRNPVCITKEEGLKLAKTMSRKALCCVYKPTTAYGDGVNDGFSDHGLIKDRFRKTGEEFLATKSIAIGCASENGGYLGIVEKEGKQVEGVLCDFYIWASKYLNIASLIEDICQSGEELYSSCEYFYSKYETKDGVKYPKDCCFEQHCILGSGENGNLVVEPAYSSSKLVSFNEKLSKEINQLFKEGDEMTVEERLKILNELSHGDIRSLLFTELGKVMVADEFNSIWISSYDVYDTHFLYELWNKTEEKYNYFKVEYKKNEDDTITINFDGKEQVKRENVWVSVNQVEEVTKSLNEITGEKEQLEVKVDELNKELNSKDENIKELNSKVEELNISKNDIEEKFNSASEKVVALNSKVQELEPLVEEYNNAKLQKEINEKVSYYEEKFIGLNAKEKFDTIEIQELIKKSINDTESTLQLNTMLLDMVKVPTVDSQKKTVKEMNSKEMKNLIPKINESVENKYGFI